MKFAMAYSCGKDSTMAMKKMLDEGHELVAIIVSFSKNQNCSFFHGVKREFLEQYAETLGCELILCEIDSADNYDAIFTAGVRRAKELGAEALVFGDIDIQGHRQWDDERAKEGGIKGLWPLWGVNRRQNVLDVLDSGIKALIVSVDTEKLPVEYLGKILDRNMLKKFEKAGIDVCGENGEYHTMVVDAPMFKFALEYEIGKVYGESQWKVIEVVDKNIVRC